jgi:hypothetical protein
MKRILIVTVLLASLPAFGGRKEGLQQEFRAVEEALRNKQIGPEARQKTLDANLTNAVRLSVVRHFYDNREEMLKDLGPATIEYENPTSPVVYYVKYKNAMLMFKFARDPELFLQSPEFEKFLDSAEADLTHREQPKPAQPAQPAQPNP